MIINRSLILEASLLLPYINQMIMTVLAFCYGTRSLIFARAVNGKFCHQNNIASPIQIVSGNC